jgi:signal peptidase I
LCDRFKDCVLPDEKQGLRVFKIPGGHYFCMGDNRDNSDDSRFWGPLPHEYIIGRPWRIYWSYESTTADYLTPGLFHRIKDLFLTVVHFFTRTRWGRTFKKFE